MRTCVPRYVVSYPVNSSQVVLELDVKPRDGRLDAIAVPVGAGISVQEPHCVSRVMYQYSAEVLSKQTSLKLTRFGGQFD